MSKFDAYADAGEQVLPIAPRLADTIANLARAAQALVSGFAIAAQQLWFRRRIRSFPDHRLADIGFERDWDGSIIAVVKEPSHR